MKLEQFKAGVWRQQYQYKSFSPVPINQAWTWEDPGIHVLLERANRALGELNAFSLIVPDIDLFIRMHVVKEAHASSRIEGTQTGMDEALMSEGQIRPEHRNDWREVQNYIEAINTSIEDLARVPLSNRLLKNAHATLMRGVRGEHKLPGEFRISQNWIGGSGLTDAVFIPPSQGEVADLMGDLEKFLHNEHIQVPHLVRVALAHYQFETVHPFLDGNGRIGRLLVPLYLVGHGLLDKPSLYLSDFFERNRSSYYDALMRVRTQNDVLHWLRFFLTGVAETATKGRDVFRAVLALRIEVEEKASSLGKRSVLARRALRLLYKIPYLSAGILAVNLQISPPTANALVREFLRLGILRQVGKHRRDRQFVFESYRALFAN